MFVSLRMLSLPVENRDRIPQIVEALGDIGPRLAGVKSSWVAPVSRVAVINAGDIVWRLTFASEADAMFLPSTGIWQREVAPLLAGTQVIGAGYRMTRAKIRREGPGIWRALLFRIMPHGLSRLKEFERGTNLLPDHIQEIRASALSPVSLVEGPKQFTYVVEQEFDSTADLTGIYLTHPAHWGVADTIFDADFPEYMVDPMLIQLVGDIDHSIIADAAEYP